MAERNQDWHVEGTMAKAERDALLLALERHGFSAEKAAAALRIGRTTVYRLVSRYGIMASERARRDAAVTRLPTDIGIDVERPTEQTVASSVPADPAAVAAVAAEGRTRAAPPLGYHSFARTAVQARVRFTDDFPTAGFPVLAFDFLLHLYASQGEGAVVNVTTSARALRTSVTTVLRCVSTLESADLIESRSDPADRRIVLVRLTTTGQRQLTQYFEEFPLRRKRK